MIVWFAERFLQSALFDRNIDISVGGDEAPVKIIDRPKPQAVLQETDANRLVAGFSTGISHILVRAAPVFAILTEAATTEPELDELQKRFRDERLDNMRRVAHAIGRLLLSDEEKL